MPLRSTLLLRTTAAIILGLFTSIALATWLALRPATTFTFNHSLGINSSPEGSPYYRSNYNLADEYRPGYRRIQVSARDKPINDLAAARLKAELTATDRTPKYPNNKGPSRTPQRPFWPSWVPTPTTDSFSDVSGRAAGWPWLCLHSTSTQATPTSSPQPSGSIRILTQSWYPPAASGFYSSDPELGTAPILPLWPGLIGNTALFAAPWLVLLTLPPLLRARLRRGRNLCPACGYDLSALPSTSPCPECGRVTPTTSTPPA